MKHSEDVKLFNEQVEKVMRAAIKEAATQGFEIAHDMESDVMECNLKEKLTSIEDAIMAGNKGIKSIVSRYDIFTRQYHPVYVACMEKIANNLNGVIATARVEKSESYTYTALWSIKNNIDEVLEYMDKGDGEIPESMDDDYDEVFEQVEKES